MAASLITIVDFHNDPIFAIQCDDGVFVALKPIIERFGLKWHGQYERTMRDRVLREGIRVLRMPSVGGPQETVCLRLELVAGWLFGIDDRRVKADAQETVLAYKRECHETLFNHFYSKRPAGQPTAEEIAAVQASEAAKLRHVAEVRLTFGHAAAAQLYIELGLKVVPAMLRDPRMRDLFDPTDPDAIITVGGMQ